MNVKSKQELRAALARILEKAKVHRDFSDYDTNRAAWQEVIELAYEALDRPTMADIEELLK